MFRWWRRAAEPSEAARRVAEHDRRGEELSGAAEALLGQTTLTALADEPGYRERGARLVARRTGGIPAPHLTEAFAAALAIRERILDGPDPHWAGSRLE